jgi:arabinose-5-phosphate isomerase
VDLVVRCADAGGSVVVSGLGKSGLIGQKISATLASLAIPSHEIHPADALHGDLGRIRKNDCALLLSNSGETDEVVTLALSLKQDGIRMISITGGEGGSTLARIADVALSLGQISEAGDLGLAPTCSTTATLALGDALALTAARRRAFTADEFAKRHPGGKLGGLLRPVVDVLRFSVVRGNLPCVDQKLTVGQALGEAEKVSRRPGAMLAVDGDGRLVGIFTDADLRRLVHKDPDARNKIVHDVMTRQPKTLRDVALVRDAVRLVREHRSDEIPVVDAQGKPVGLLDVQELIALRVVEH